MKIFFATILAAFLFMTNIASAEVEVNRAELIQRALDAQKNSYAPYSHFKVAAAVLCSSGKIYTGVNVENADYTAGISAIRNAIFHAAAEGERQICAVAVVAGLNGVNTDYSPPSGICRQVMREFANPKELLIIMAKSPNDYIEKTLEELLPMSFDPDSLK